MIFRSIIKTFKSLRLTVYILISLTAVMLAGQIIPQKDVIGTAMYEQWKAQRPGLVESLELFGLTEIYAAPVTLALWALFFANLIAVMSVRIPIIWRKCANEGVSADAVFDRPADCIATVEGDIEGVAAALKNMRYEVFSGPGAFRAVRNRFSPLATVIFHLSFLLLLIGGVTVFYTRFRAEADLAVGEAFEGQYDRRSEPIIGEVPETVFRVEEASPSYYKKDLLVDLTVVLDTADGRKTVGINRPYNNGTLSFLIKTIDVAPLFVVEDRDGREVDGAFVKLMGIAGKEETFTMAGYDFRPVFYTDILNVSEFDLDETANLPQSMKQFPQSSRRTQHKEIVNPAFKIAVSKDGEPLGEDIIKPGEHLEFDGRRLIFKELRYWVRFYVGHEYGLGVVYAGFALMIPALAARFFFYRRELAGKELDGKVYIEGKSEYFKALYSDEFESIVRRLRGES